MLSQGAVFVFYFKLIISTGKCPPVGLWQESAVTSYPAELQAKVRPPVEKSRLQRNREREKNQLY